MLESLGARVMRNTLGWSWATREGLQMQSQTARTPEPVARQLRQEAAFGCCRCGYPIVQYHHIIPYAEDHHFRPEDMMALCPNCHDAANNGAITVEQQRHHKSRPHNLKRGYAAGLLTVNDRSLQIKMGSNTFVGEGTIIRADMEPLVTLDLNNSGSVEITLNLYDERDKLVASIHKNEWISYDPLPWDINAGYQKLRIRRRKGLVALDLDLRQTPAHLSTSLWWRGHLISVSPSTMCVDRNGLNCQFVGCMFERLSLLFSTSPKPAVKIVHDRTHQTDTS